MRPAQGTRLRAILRELALLGPDACWPWPYRVTADGYGVVSAYGGTRKAYRAAYTELVGPIPEGLHIDHLCRNKLCVNPRHLEPVTQQENNRRRWEHDRRDTCKHGHPWTPENTKVIRHRDGNTARWCRRCGIIRTTEHRRRKAAEKKKSRAA